MKKHEHTLCQNDNRRKCVFILSFYNAFISKIATFLTLPFITNTTSDRISKHLQLVANAMSSFANECLTYAYSFNKIYLTMTTPFSFTNALQLGLLW